MKRVLLFGTVIMVALVMSPMASWAGPPPDVDAMIRGGLTDNYKGENVLTPGSPISQQTARARTRIGRSANFQIKAENNDDLSDTFSVDGCGSSPGFKVTYKEGGVNFTDEVKDGSHTQFIPAMDFNDDLRLKIEVKDSADVGDIKKCKVVFESDNDSDEDTVRAKLKVKAG
ncbi:MAG: hypothetical protein WD757_07355 [Actinomycetota bacterium]